MLAALATLLLAPAAAEAKLLKLRPADRDRHGATFEVAKLPVEKIRSAKVRTRRGAHKLSVKRLKRAVPTGRLTIRARGAASKGRAKRLIVKLDTTAPETVIDTAPSGTVQPGAVSVTFAASEPAAFSCRVDYGDWRECASPDHLAELPAGEHRFEVRATDTAGNVDGSPASAAWTVASAAEGSPPPADETAPPADGSTPPAGETAPGSATSTTRPVGSPALSDAEAAARVHRSAWEPRPENAVANGRTPTTSELSAFYGTSSGWTCQGSRRLVTGNFTGTTDEVIQWAAWKWGVDEEALRAMAVIESYWRQDAHGDVGNGESWGLLQIKQSVHSGTYPLSLASTAFNADYLGMVLRYYYDGCGGWLNDVDRGQTYAAGDFWGSVGAWYAGRWHTAAAESYIAKVKDALNLRTWAKPGF